MLATTKRNNNNSMGHSKSGSRPQNTKSQKLRNAILKNHEPKTWNNNDNIILSNKISNIAHKNLDSYYIWLAIK